MEHIETEYVICKTASSIDNEQNINSMEFNNRIEIIENEQEEEEEEEDDGMDISDLIKSKPQNFQTIFTRLGEATKHSVTYRKLVVPQSMRSIYWKFFGFPADENGEIITRAKIICLLCQTQIAYNRNTSNLRMHLQNKHIQELHDLETASPPRKPIITPESKEKRAQKRLLKAAMAASSQHIYTTNMEGMVHINEDLQLVADPFCEQSLEENIGKSLNLVLKNNASGNQNIAFVLPEQNQQTLDNNIKTVDDAILEFLIMDLQLPQIVQGLGFQRLISTLKSPCQMHDKAFIEDDTIPRTYMTFKDNILNSISLLSSEVSIAIEEWTSDNAESFFTFSIYYQHPDDIALETKNLRTLHGPEDWDQHQWESAIDAIFNEWCIKIGKVTAVIVSTTRQELVNALLAKNLSVIPCLLHSLQICAQACFDDEHVKKILSKCRMILGVISSNPDLAAELAVQEQVNEFENNAMVMDCPSVWMSTYTMLQQMIPRRNIITYILQNFENFDISSFDLDDDQWQIVNDLVIVLEPFKVIIETLSDERIPPISLLKPLLWQLTSTHLKVTDTDSDVAKAFKESLAQMLCERYMEADVSLLLQIATNLDPRFKEVPYATDEDKKLITSPIKDMLVRQLEEDGDLVENKNEEESPSKKTKISSGMELLLGGLYSNKRNMSAQEKADLELAQYQSEPTAELNNCPLEWWSKIAVKCPNLVKIANRYNCIPVCCPPPSRIPAHVQLQYHAKRAALPPHLVDKMLFLNANHSLFEACEV